MKIAEIHTKKGVMKIKFFEADTPNTVKNFTDLASKGYYNGLIFHRDIGCRLSIHSQSYIQDHRFPHHRGNLPES